MAFCIFLGDSFYGVLAILDPFQGINMANLGVPVHFFWLFGLGLCVFSSDPMRIHQDPLILVMDLAIYSHDRAEYTKNNTPPPPTSWPKQIKCYWTLESACFSVHKIGHVGYHWKSLAKPYSRRLRSIFVAVVCCIVPSSTSECVSVMEDKQSTSSATHYTLGNNPTLYHPSHVSVILTHSIVGRNTAPLSITLYHQMIRAYYSLVI